MTAWDATCRPIATQLADVNVRKPTRSSSSRPRRRFDEGAEPLHHMPHGQDDESGRSTRSSRGRSSRPGASRN